MSAVDTSIWQVQEAKNRLSELIDLSLRLGPQTITRHGKPVVQIVPLGDARSGAQSDSLISDSFTAHLLAAPRGAGLPDMKRRNRRAAPELG